MSFLGIVFLLGLLATTFKFLYADAIPFENTLSTTFSWLNTWNYSNAHFKYWGNSFVGVIFWQTGITLSTPETINISSWGFGQQSIVCSTQLRGIYYNNQRGRRIWPLDTGNLNILQAALPASWYNTMTISNWFFTNCTWVIWGTYMPYATDVYGQIDHTVGTQTGFRMIAGINYNFIGNTYSGTSFGHTLTYSSNTNTWYLFDTNWGIAELSMNVPLCVNFTSTPASQPIVIAYTSGMSFTCYGTNVSWYILGVTYSWSTIPFYTGQVSTNNSSYTRTTGSTLATGDYIATCTVLWPTYVWPQCWTQIPFHVGITGTTPPPPWTGCITGLQWEISFSSLSGSNVVNAGLGTFYTNKTGVTLQLAATQPTHFVVSGDFIGTPRIGDYLYNTIFTPILSTITLQNTNAFNNFSSTYTTGLLCPYVDYAKRIYVDTIAPTPAPVATLSTTNICSSLPLTINRTASSTDTGAWLGSYRYEIFNNSGMVTGLMLYGTTGGSTTSISINIALLPLWTYYVRILALDTVGNTSTSNTISFTSSQQYCGISWTGVVIVTPTIWLRNLDLDKIYRSDPIWILGLTWSTPVSVSKGMLFINNNTGGWTTGLITSADTIYIEMVSSDKFDTTVTSNLSILGLTWTFSLTTKKSSCDLSTAEKLVIQNIYANLKDEYNNDISKYTDFLNTFQSMVQDESDLSDSCTLDYLLILIEDDFWSTDGIDTSNHITPNCKEYSIWYDTQQRAYYAPEMMNRYYFINRESLIRHLDYYNPGDCHINTYGTNFRTADTSDSMRHIAPNGKIYTLIGQYGGYSANEFTTPKYFDSLSSIKMFIDLRNPPKDIWKHTIDDTFIPIVYAAPNGKEYKTYKTDRWYMSYKLMKVRYYPTLSELKHYIDVNNPSKR